MKKLKYAIVSVIMAASLLISGCSGGGEAQKTDLTENKAPVVTGTSSAETTAATEKTEAVTEEVKADTGELSINLNGESYDIVGSGYTISDGISIAAITGKKDDTIVLIMAELSAGTVNSGAAYSQSDFGDNIAIEIDVYDGVSKKDYIGTTMNSTTISKGSIVIKEYGEKAFIDTEISGSFSGDGLKCDFNASGRALYCEPEEFSRNVLGAIANTNSVSSDSIVANACGACNGTGICYICGGSGTCQVCFGRGGVSYNTWGQGGSGWVECQGCHGNRKCKYCGGGGKCDFCGGSGQ